MKKKIVLIPLFALSLSGCSLLNNIPVVSKLKTIAGALIGNVLGGGSTSTAQDTTNNNNTNYPTTISVSVPDVPVMADQGPTEYGNYKRVDSAPVDGKEYLLGMCQGNLSSKMLFMDGGVHCGYASSDTSHTTLKLFPFYATATSDTSAAAKIKCVYTGTNTFTLQYISGGKGNYTPADPEDPSKTLSALNNTGTYLSIKYNADGNKKTSFYFSDTPVNWLFSASEVYNNTTYNMNTIFVNIDQGGSYAAQNCCLGTYEEFETFSACTPNNFGTNYFAHLWEAK